MSNSFFKFKQFIIHQDKCSMKVSTDACLLGAWVTVSSSVKNVLDIGTGTGVLSLMLAQKNNLLQIDAVEIEQHAFIQSTENFNHSIFENQLSCYHQSIQDFTKTATKKYDIIISNPPYFEGDLQTDNAKNNLAKHSAALTLEELINCINQLLADDGICYLVLPNHRIKELKMGIEEICFIQDNPTANIKRALLKLNKKTTTTSRKTLLIKNNDGSYTPEFMILMKQYYCFL